MSLTGLDYLTAPLRDPNRFWPPEQFSPDYLARVKAWEEEERRVQKITRELAEKAARAPKTNYREWDAMDACPSPTSKTMPGYNDLYQMLRPTRLSMRRARVAEQPSERWLTPPATPHPPQPRKPPPYLKPLLLGPESANAYVNEAEDYKQCAAYNKQGLEAEAGNIYHTGRDQDSRSAATNI
ncbi:MAG: hypothetical protein Q9163_005739 [Psora crenata]